MCVSSDRTSEESVEVVSWHAPHGFGVLTMAHESNQMPTYDVCYSTPYRCCGPYAWFDNEMDHRKLCRWRLGTPTNSSTNTVVNRDPLIHIPWFHDIPRALSIKHCTLQVEEYLQSKGSKQGLGTGFSVRQGVCRGKLWTNCSYDFLDWLMYDFLVKAFFLLFDLPCGCVQRPFIASDLWAGWFSWLVHRGFRCRLSPPAERWRVSSPWRKMSSAAQFWTTEHSAGKRGSNEENIRGSDVFSQPLNLRQNPKMREWSP